MVENKATNVSLECFHYTTGRSLLGLEPRPFICNINEVTLVFTSTKEPDTSLELVTSGLQDRCTSTCAYQASERVLIEESLSHSVGAS